ncbi:MAG: Hint domain-containing protein [Paracoccaceae bacterium]
MSGGDNNFSNPSNPNLIGLWDFITGNVNADTGLADGAAQNVTFYNSAASVNDALETDGIDDYANVEHPVTDTSFDIDSGTLEVEFTQAAHVGAGNNTIVSRGEEADKADDGWFGIDVTADGRVVVEHTVGTNYGGPVTVTLETAAGFLAPGDDVRVTYSFDATDGARLKVENVTDGTETVLTSTVTGLTFEITDKDIQAFTFGAREADDGVYDQQFNGEINYVAVYNVAMGMGAGDGIVEGTAGADIIDINYLGDPEGDRIDNNDAILPGEAPQDDIVQAFEGDDLVESGEGNDTVYAGEGEDTVFGGAGEDEIYGDSSGPGGPGGGGGANLVVNGSFEDVTGLASTFYGYVGTGAIPGWTTTDPNSDLDVHNDGRGQIDPTDGENWLDLEASPGDIRVGQDIQGMADGQTYTLSFDAGDGQGVPGSLGENTINVYFGGELIATIDPEQGQMDTYTFDIVGGSGNGSDRLEFEGVGPDDKYGASIDNVSIFEAGAPGFDDTLYGGDGDDIIFGEGGNDTIYGDSGGAGGGSGDNLIVNGSFEDVTGLTTTFYGYVGTGSIPGWTADNQTDDLDVHNDGRGNIDPTDGENWLDLEASPGDIRVGQDVQGVVTGETYTLSFDAGDGENIGGSLGENIVNVYWGGELIATIDPEQGQMDTYTFEVEGGSGDGSNRLEFEGVGPDDKYGVSIDNVSLVLTSTQGDDGNDTLDGGEGDDTIFGEGGDDTIIGGKGEDVQSGGDGQDTFTGSTKEEFFGDTIDGGAGGVDFDVIDLTGTGVTTSDFEVIVDGPDSNGNGIDGRINWLDGSGGIIGVTEFTEIEKIIPCFTPGTLIATAQGERPVEDLRPGDRVITRDNGIQEIAWAGSKALSYEALQNEASLRPVLIRKGALGRGLPERDMLLSPNHRVLMANERTEILFGEPEVLVPAKHLVGMEGISRASALGVTYVHFMFERHEVVLSDGSWTESFQPGAHSLKGVERQQRAEILRLFPELATEDGQRAYGSARNTLKKHEADILARLS